MPKVSIIDSLPPDMQRKWREFSARGGRKGSREDKVRAGKLGAAARIRKLKEAAEKKDQSHG